MNSKPPGWEEIQRFQSFLRTKDYWQSEDRRWHRGEKIVDIGYQNKEWTITVRPKFHPINPETEYDTDQFRFLPEVNDRLPDALFVVV